MEVCSRHFGTARRRANICCTARADRGWRTDCRLASRAAQHPARGRRAATGGAARHGSAGFDPAGVHVRVLRLPGNPSLSAVGRPRPARWWWSSKRRDLLSKVVPVTERDVIELAGHLPAACHVDRSLARTLAAYVGRRRYFEGGARAKRMSRSLGELLESAATNRRHWPATTGCSARCTSVRSLRIGPAPKVSPRQQHPLHHGQNSRAPRWQRSDLLRRDRTSTVGSTSCDNLT